jgi:uncharacterized protein (DUF1015 family)
MRIQPLQLLSPDQGTVPSLRDLAIRAKDDFPQQYANGCYRTLENAIVIYQIRANGRAHTGILANNDIRDFDLGRIKKHEKTLARREAEYHVLLQQWKAVIKPVLLTFPANDDFRLWIEDYTESHTPDVVLPIPEDGEEHCYWLVSEPAQVQAIKTIMANVEATYIADGHHRTTTIANFSKIPPSERGNLDFSHLFAAFFPDDQLRILGYHRLVTLDTAAEAVDFCQKINTLVSLTHLPSPRMPAHRREVVLVHNGQCHVLDFSKIVGDEHQWTLDTSLLNDLVFMQILGVADVRSDKRVTYIDGAKGLEGMLEATLEANKVGFLMHPVSFEELYHLSDRDETLPPKSTWFEPRMKSGLAVGLLGGLAAHFS